jgi:hypothetical protein
MAQPEWNPDTGGRSLAEILREAGIESASRAARRRSWDDPEETGIRQRRAEAAAAGAAADRAGYGRRRSDLSGGDQTPPPRDRPDFSRPAPGPSTAAIPGLRPDRKPGVPLATAQPSAPVFERRTAAPPEERTPRRSAQRSEPRSAPRSEPRSAPRSAPPVDEHPSTGPIPVVAADDLDADLDATPQESALAWLRFAGELVIAVAAGVAVYFAARLLWDWAPYGAMLLAPLAVAGLTGGVGMWRQRQGREPAGVLFIGVLVFAGTLLTIAPAAELIAGS